MKLQHISFKTAKLAHQKGFSADDVMNSRSGCYTLKKTKVWQPGVPDNWQEEIEEGHYFDIEPSLTKEYRHKWRDLLAWAPSQDLLKKWLREKHNIDVIVYKDFSDYRGPSYRYNGYSTKVSKVTEEGKTYGESVLAKQIWGECHEKYEQALEEGLQTALEQISE